MTDNPVSARHRMAAIVALVTFAGAVILLVVAASANLGAMFMMLVGLIITVLGMWHLATRRGAFRILAVVVVLVGLATLIEGVTWFDLKGWWTVAVVALALVSVGAARIALHDQVQDHRGLTDRPSDIRTHHPVLIMNLKSGGGKAERFHLVDECEKRGIEPIVLDRGDDLVQLAEQAVDRGADIIGMAGGDGSQAVVASVAARHNLPYVVVPAGTRNHFALDLGLDRDDVVGALDAFADGVDVLIDLATVNGRVFVNNATLGLYAKIVQAPEYRDAKRQTTASMLPDLLGPDAPGLDLRFSGPDGALHTTTDVLLISNNPYELHSFVGRGTRSRLDRAVLGIASATVDNAVAAARFITLEIAGHVRRFPGWQEWTAPHFEVNADSPVEIGIDGEALRMDPPLVFESMPAALRVRLPTRASGRSPSARALHLASRSTLGDLFRTAIMSGHFRTVEGI